MIIAIIIIIILITKLYNTIDQIRYTNLKKLFLSQYNKQPTKIESSSFASFVDTCIDESCVNSCLVFIDGKLDSSLSRVTNIPKEVTASAFSLMDSTTTTSTTTIEQIAAYIPDKEELPRDSYASDIITAWNLVTISMLTTTTIFQLTSKDNT